MFLSVYDNSQQKQGSRWMEYFRWKRWSITYHCTETCKDVKKPGSGTHRRLGMRARRPGRPVWSHSLSQRHSISGSTTGHPCSAQVHISSISTFTTREAADTARRDAGHHPDPQNQHVAWQWTRRFPPSTFPDQQTVEEKWLKHMQATCCEMMIDVVVEDDTLLSLLSIYFYSLVFAMRAHGHKAEDELSVYCTQISVYLLGLSWL